MDSLQTDSTVRTLLFHLGVCGPHVDFRGVNHKALATQQLVHLTEGENTKSAKFTRIRLFPVLACLFEKLLVAL